MAAAMTETETIAEAVRVASRAPSLHNSQPWQWVLVGGERLQLFLATDRVMPSDRSDRQALIGCGAMLDHLRVALAAAGWRARIEHFPDAGDKNHLASVSCDPLAEVTDDDRRRADAIVQRRSDRLPFYAPPPGAWSDAAAPGIAGTGAVRIDVIDGERRQRLVEASQLAESLRLYDGLYHAELDRWTVSFAAADGVPYESLASAAESDRVEMGRAFPTPAHPERRRELPDDDASLLVLSTDSDDPADALAAGEMLSAVLLHCTLAGLATCPLTHLTEVRASRQKVRSLLDHDGLPQILVRAGVAPVVEHTPPTTPRRPLHEILQLRS